MRTSVSFHNDKNKKRSNEEDTNNNESLGDTMKRLAQEDSKFQNFWVGVTNIVESYRSRQRHPNQISEEDRKRYQHSVRRKAVSMKF